MDLLFPAIEERFKRDFALTRRARQLFHGFETSPEKYLPYVTCTRTGGNSLDTFELDFEEYVLQFTCWAEGPQGLRCAEIMRHIQRVFKRAIIIADNLRTTHWMLTGKRGPILLDGNYQGVVMFEFMAEFDVRTPAAAMVEVV